MKETIDSGTKKRFRKKKGPIIDLSTAQVPEMCEKSSEEKPSLSRGEDGGKWNPDAKVLTKAEQAADAKEDNKILLHKVGVRVLAFLIPAILILILFFILPFSAMEPMFESYVECEDGSLTSYGSRGVLALPFRERFRLYSVAFVGALGGFGVTVVAVLVSEGLKFAYGVLKKKGKQNNAENTSF